MRPKTPRILVVDPHKPTCEVIAAILRSDGYVTETAASVAQGVRLLEGPPFQAVLVDLDDEAGLQPGESLAPVLLAKTKEKNPEAKIVALAGPRAYHYSDLDAHLEKPFSYSSLLRLIRRLLLPEVKITALSGVTSGRSFF